MSRRSTSAAHIALALGLAGVACSQPASPSPSDAAVPAVPEVEGSAWIEGQVQGRPGTRVIATATHEPQAFFAATTAADGSYRLGPVPAGEYEVTPFTSLRHPELVDNFTAALVTATDETPAVANFSQPGDGSIRVRFAAAPTPGTMVTAVTLFTGVQADVSEKRYRELHQAQRHLRGRNTISADDLTTTFNGLLPGEYTACALTNVGGEDLRPTCQATHVQQTVVAELSLDVRVR